MRKVSLQTESARKALLAFHCDLCGKGYARRDEYERHEASYDHMHRVRHRDAQVIQRSMGAGKNEARRAAEEKSSGLVRVDKHEGEEVIKKGSGGFKNAFGADSNQADPSDKQEGQQMPTSRVTAQQEPENAANDSSETDSADEGYELYDPSKPTGCPPDCPGRQAAGDHKH